MMTKYTFICEDEFNGSKVTFESNPTSMEGLLQDFAQFMKGSGFVFDGYLDVIDPSMPESACTSEYDYGIEIDDELDYDHPEANFDYNEQKEDTKCSLCGISKEIMAHHQCFDKKCPRGTW
jgi:hypothetical protein